MNMQDKPILLVEDSAAQRRMLSAYLAACEHEVVTAKNGQEALQLAGTLDPVLILMDIDMPVMNGLDACRALTRGPDTQHIPVVMLSALGEDAMRLRATMRGASNYLTKPVTQQKLCNTLRPLLEEYNQEHP